MSSQSNYLEITAHWFHAIDVPLRDPNKKPPKSTTSSSSTTTTSSTPSSTSASSVTLSNSNKVYPSKQPVNWIPFSKRDSNALEAAYKSGSSETKVLCNEDYLFEVDIPSREIGPVYWLGPTYEVIRATWFYQSDGKFLPCNESLSNQIEEGYKKHKVWIPPPETESTEQTEHVQEKLFGNKYTSQYVVYTNPTTAWLLSNDMTGNLTKTVFAKLTNGVHLGGTKLIRGYNEVKKLTTGKSPEEEVKYKNEFDNLASNVRSIPTPETNQKDVKETVGNEDYDNNDDNEGEERVIDHLILVIHGIGQKLSERMEYVNFVHDVNTLRKTIKSTYSTTLGFDTPSKNTKNKSDSSIDRRGTSTPDRNVHNAQKFGNGIQVLPIQWRQEIKFGMASDDENVQRDLGMPEAEEGQTTLDEITLEGVPTLRTLISDVLMDVLLYMTPRYREMMINTVTREMNRVYNLFIKRNPKFVENGGKVSLYGHSLGSVLAFDILCHQPPLFPSTPSGIFEEKGSADMDIIHQRTVKLDFEVANFFAAGSPIGLFLLLKGLKVASRKDRTEHRMSQNFSQTLASAAMEMGVSIDLPLSHSIIPLCYPSVKNIYNIFHNADPIAYRLEPLIARHYGSSIKPALIPYHKGGLKGMHLGIQEFGNEIASKATNIFSTVRTSLLFTKGIQSIISQNNSNVNNNNSSHKRSNSIPNNTSGENNENSGGGSALTNYPPTNFSSSPNPSEKSNINEDPNGAARIKSLNSSGRVDWVLQEGLLDVSYINAITVHLGYWSDCDAVNFIIKEIYRDNDEIKN